MRDAMDYDVLVVGAGAGGLLTAARLTHAGYRTLVVERLGQVGGRASTRDVDGFKVNNGAIVIETGGITEQTFAEVGAEFDVRSPVPPVLYRVGGRDIDVTGGGWGFLLSRLTRQGAKVLAGLADARQDSGLPETGLSTSDWLGNLPGTRPSTASSVPCAARSSPSALTSFLLGCSSRTSPARAPSRNLASARRARSASGSRWRG
jgi:phytoene dehydrogenase-like protein